MNRVGIDYVCIGNHESDIPMPQLWNRIKQSRFTWVRRVLLHVCMQTLGLICTL